MEETDTNTATVHQERGNSLFREGDYDGAIAAYSAALREAVSLYAAGEEAMLCAVLLSNRAACYLHVQRPSLAARDALLASRLSPNYAKAHYRLARALEQMGDQSGATQALARSRQRRRARPGQT